MQVQTSLGYSRSVAPVQHPLQRTKQKFLVRPFFVPEQQTATQHFGFSLKAILPLLLLLFTGLASLTGQAQDTISMDSLTLVTDKPEPDTLKYPNPSPLKLLIGKVSPSSYTFNEQSLKGVDDQNPMFKFGFARANYVSPVMTMEDPFYLNAYGLFSQGSPLIIEAGQYAEETGKPIPEDASHVIIIKELDGTFTVYTGVFYDPETKALTTAK